MIFDKETYKKYINSLEKFFLDKKMLVVCCTDNVTGEIIPVLCRYKERKNGTIDAVPMAVLFGPDPFSQVSLMSDTSDTVLAKQKGSTLFKIEGKKKDKPTDLTLN
jgi:hypothetical protein